MKMLIDTREHEALLVVVAEAREIVDAISESGEIWGADGLAEALAKLDAVRRKEE